MSCIHPNDSDSFEKCDTKAPIHSLLLPAFLPFTGDNVIVAMSESFGGKREIDGNRDENLL